LLFTNLIIFTELYWVCRSYFVQISFVVEYLRTQLSALLEETTHAILLRQWFSHAIRKHCRVGMLLQLSLFDRKTLWPRLSDENRFTCFVLSTSDRDHGQAGLVSTSETHPPQAWRILLNTAEEYTYTRISQ